MDRMAFKPPYPRLKVLNKIYELRQKASFSYAMLTLLGIGVGLISLLLGATIYGVEMFLSYFSSPTLLLLNLLPPILLIFLLYFISGRAWIAFTITAITATTLSTVNFFKVQIRGDPFIASDIVFFREVRSLISGYTLTFNWKLTLAIIALIIGALLSSIVLKHRPEKAMFRIIAAVAIAALSIALYALVYASEDLYAKTLPGTEGVEISSIREKTAKGFLYSFIHSIGNTGSTGNIGNMGNIGSTSAGSFEWGDVQELYSPTAETHFNTDIPDSKKVNIICIMLESYADLSSYDNIEFLIDVYGPLHKLQEESVTGELITNIALGGTIDTERLFLTGYTNLTPYSSATNSYVHYLKSQGYSTEGLHTGDAWYYDRAIVNAYLGFDNYYFLDDYENSNRYDSFFFSALSNLYEKRDRSKPYFNFSLTYQNHGPYDDTKTSETHYISQNGLTIETFNILNNYLRGINDTTQRVADFTEALRYDRDPVVVVVFSDHMPWLGNNHSGYAELGVNMDRDSEEWFYNFFSTMYFIWANDAAKEALGNSFTGDGGSFSPFYLMGEVFDLCSWEGDFYMQTLKELKVHVDVISRLHGLYRENGALTKNLSPYASAIYQRLKIMEHYRLNNFAY